MQEIWGQGFVYINAIKHVDNVGAYIVKYMTKDNSDLRLQGLKAYLCSRNLKKPESILNHDFIEFDKSEKRLEKRFNISKLNPVYETLFESEVLGSCEYKQYNLKREKK